MVFANRLAVLKWQEAQKKTYENRSDEARFTLAILKRIHGKMSLIQLQRREKSKAESRTLWWNLQSF